MRYFVIGLIVLAIIAVVLYFVLSRMYDYFSFKSNASDIAHESRIHHQEELLRKRALEEKKQQLEQSIAIRSKHFQSLEEIKELEKELEQINGIIRNIEKNT